MMRTRQNVTGLDFEERWQSMPTRRSARTARWWSTTSMSSIPWMRRPGHVGVRRTRVCGGAGLFDDPAGAKGGACCAPTPQVLQIW